MVRYFDIYTRPKYLEFGDIVSFVHKGTSMKYIVREHIMGIQDVGLDNDQIFRSLGIDGNELANRIYGYGYGNDRGWPRVSKFDYPSLTKLVNALFDLIEEENKRIAYNKETINVLPVYPPLYPLGSKEYPYSIDRPPQLAQLRLGDYVIIDGLLHCVNNTYLRSTEYSFNDKVFTNLKLDPGLTAAQSYGYVPRLVNSGSWPECKSGDYPALTRLVNYLFTVIKSKNDGKVQRQDPAESGREGPGPVRIYKCTGTIAAPELHTQYPVRGTKIRSQIGSSQIRDSVITPSYY